MERTLTILKPDSVAAGKAGAILAHLEKEGFRLHRAQEDAAVARAGARVLRGAQGALVLRRARALHDRGPGRRRRARARGRGAAPAPDDGRDRLAQGRPGHVRNLFGTDIERNAIHGSDSAENAAKEIAFFFGESGADLVAVRTWRRSGAASPAPGSPRRAGSPPRASSAAAPRRGASSRAASARGGPCRRSRSRRARGPSARWRPRSRRRAPRAPAAGDGSSGAANAVATPSTSATACERFIVGKAGSVGRRRQAEARASSSSVRPLRSGPKTKAVGSRAGLARESRAAPRARAARARPRPRSEEVVTTTGNSATASSRVAEARDRAEQVVRRPTASRAESGSGSTAGSTTEKSRRPKFFATRATEPRLDALWGRTRTIDRAGVVKGGQCIQPEAGNGKEAARSSLIICR